MVRKTRNVLWGFQNQYPQFSGNEYHYDASKKSTFTLKINNSFDENNIQISISESISESKLGDLDTEYPKSWSPI
jgi:hypothetical protein